MWEWFRSVGSNNVLTSRQTLQEQTLVYAKPVGISESDFIASIVWLNMFRGRLNIKVAAVCGWLVACFGLNGTLRQYFSLYRAVSQREGERKEK